MKTRTVYVVVFACLAASSVGASVVVTVDKLDSEPDAANIPSSLVIADVYANLSPGDSWTAGGIQGQALNGAFLAYYFDQNQPSLCAIPDASRFSTRISRPWPSRYVAPPPAVPGPPSPPEAA